MSRRRRKLPTSTYQADIERFNHELKGVTRVDGKATFIQGALPGESVTFKYHLRKRNYDEGHVIEVLKPSVKRVDAKCKHYSLCGGCSLQHLSSQEQINAKQALLSELLQHQAHTQPIEWLKPLTAAPWGYRNKARLSVRYVEKKQSVLVGFREQFNGRYIAEISQCEILHQAIGERIESLRELVRSLDAFKEIAQIELAAGDSEIALIIRHLAPLNESDCVKIKRFGEKNRFHMYLQPGNPSTIHKVWPEDEHDVLTYELPEFDLRYQFKPSDFTQINPEMNRLMVPLALELLDLSPEDTVLDLFCGLGNFSLPLAKRTHRVTGVEGCSDMVGRAQANAARNHVTNTQFFTADLTQDLTGEWVRNYNKLLLDPPRSGAKEVVEQIELFDCKRLVYVSCNPATLARDADILVNQKGFKLLKAGVMDMFPHTTHVESIALFER